MIFNSREFDCVSPSMLEATHEYKPLIFLFTPCSTRLEPDIMIPALLSWTTMTSFKKNRIYNLKTTENSNSSLTCGRIMKFNFFETYIVQPNDLVYVRVRINLAFEVYIVTFGYVWWIQTSSEFQVDYWGIWNKAIYFITNVSNKFWVVAKHRQINVTKSWEFWRLSFIFGKCAWFNVTQ